MNSRSFRLRCVGAALCAVAMFGAGMAGGASAKPSADPVKLTMLWSASTAAGMRILVDNFNRTHPDIQIEPQFLASDAADTLLLTQLAAGNAPDIFGINPGRRTTGVWDLAEAGRLLNLTGPKWNKRIYAPIKSAVMRNGKVYAWPYVINPFAVVFNVTLFNQLKLKVPTKFSDVLALCRQVKAAGKIPFTQGFADIAQGNIFGRQRMVEYVDSQDPKWGEKRAKKQVTFAGSQLWRRALRSIVEMNNNDCFNPGTQGTTRSQSYRVIARGDAVMSLIAAGELAAIRSIDPNLKLDMFNLPPDNAKYSVVPAIATSAAAGNARTAHPKEVRTFIDFIAREKQNSVQAKADGTIAPLDFKKGQLPPHMVKYLGPLIKAGKYADAQNVVWPNAEILNVFQRGVVGLLTGQHTVDSLLAAMDKAWDGS